MTDRELLELAAKAAGIEVYWCDSNSCFWLADESDSFVPLDHDGDALRLAVRLGLLFKHITDRYEMFMKFYYEELDNDLRPSEATRRAIVRAAAEIGKSKGEQT